MAQFTSAFLLQLTNPGFLNYFLVLHTVILAGKKQRNFPFIGRREKQNQTLPNVPAAQNVAYKYKEEL